MSALLLWLTLAAAPCRAEVVDRVEAVVEDQVVLTSDIRFDALMQRLDPTPSPYWTRPVPRPVDRLVDAAVVRHLAGDLPVYQPSDDDVQARLESLIREHFPSRGAWTAFLDGWGLDEAAMRAALRRRMVVERFLARNLAVPPSDREAWWAATDALIEQERARLRVREVPPRPDAP